MLRIVTLALCLFLASHARPQESVDCPECYESAAPQVHHHAGEGPTVDQFYSTWYKADKPTQSCCNKVDCYATTVKFENGQWHARRREDGAWLPVPPAKIERNRDS